MQDGSTTDTAGSPERTFRTTTVGELTKSKNADNRRSAHRGVPITGYSVMEQTPIEIYKNVKADVGINAGDIVMAAIRKDTSGEETFLGVILKVNGSDIIVKNESLADEENVTIVRRLDDEESVSPSLSDIAVWNAVKRTTADLIISNGNRIFSFLSGRIFSLEK